MTARPTDLPDFDDPPVAEVVLGARFTTPDKLRVFHIGAYRDLIKGDFPGFQEHPPLPARDEPGLRLVPGPPPLPRSWFLDESGNKLIQLQTDRFIHNWRKVTGEETYPRYESIREEFVSRWGEFLSFLEAHGLATPTVTECELTYVNHIPDSTYRSETGEMPALFTFLSAHAAPSVCSGLESLECSLRYSLPGDPGHLEVALGSAVRAHDQAEILRLDFSVRGPLRDPQTTGMAEWFDRARETVVRSFMELTTEQAHRWWRRKA
jgi:uncharacterized protein (TIGR04255 family)